MPKKEIMIFAVLAVVSFIVSFYVFEFMDRVYDMSN